MQMIIEYAKSEGFKRIEGQILHENTVMLKMCRELGFELKTDAEDPWSVRRHLHSRKFLASDHADEQRKLLTGCLSGRVSLVWPARVIDTRLSLAQIGEADAYR